MGKYIFRRVFLVLGLVFSLTSQVNAALVTYSYTGNWINTNGVDPQELDGATFDLTFNIDSNAIPVNSGTGFASYAGDLTVVVSGSPGDVDGTYSRSNHSMVVRTDFNGFGAISFGNVTSTVSDPVTNTGGFIFFPLPQITFGVIGDTSLPIGDFTSDVVGVWSTGTAGGGSYRGSVSNLSGTVVPLPAAIWLFGTGLIGLVGISRRTGAA